jgi:hypothetical protein
VKPQPGSITKRPIKQRVKTEKVPGLRIPITWFYLVKKFHITEPQTNVMAVLGKRFPKTAEELAQRYFATILRKD